MVDKSGVFVSAPRSFCHPKFASWPPSTSIGLVDLSLTIPLRSFASLFYPSHRPFPSHYILVCMILHMAIAYLCAYSYSPSSCMAPLSALSIKVQFPITIADEGKRKHIQHQTRRDPVHVLELEAYPSIPAYEEACP